MGARLTGTLVAANLLAVSGLAGLQLLGAVQLLEAKRLQPQASAVVIPDPARGTPKLRSAALGGSYPLHPVRVVTRIDGAEITEPRLVAAWTIGETDSAGVESIMPDDPVLSLSPIGEAKAAADLDEVAADLGRLTTAAGPAHAMRRLAPGDRSSPEEAWQASPRLRATYRTSFRARLVEAAPPAEPPSGPRAQILARILPTGAQDAVGYVVIGSYGTQENAAIEARAFSQWRPEIMSAEVKGKSYFRVAIGPFARSDLTPALKAVIADGAKNAWPLVIERNSQAAAPAVKP